MRIALTSVFVNDQDAAESFYVGVLGFVKKHDILLGENRWLTVVSAQNTAGVELLLEPAAHPAAKVFQAALLADGIPCAQFAVDDIAGEYERLTALGVRFTQAPTAMGGVTTAVLDDTCGNLIQLMEASQ